MVYARTRVCVCVCIQMRARNRQSEIDVLARARAPVLVSLRCAVDIRRIDYSLVMFGVLFWICLG